MEKRLLTVADAANALSISRTVLYELLAEGVVKSIKVGRSRRIPTQAIDEFVTDLRVRADQA